MRMTMPELPRPVTVAVGAADVDAVVADAHVEHAVGAPFEDEHAERVPGFVLVDQDGLACWWRLAVLGRGRIS